MDNTTINADEPLLFTDSDCYSTTSSHFAWNFCHAVVGHTLSWPLTSEFSIADIIQVRLHFLFSDVICIFVDDFSGLDEVTARIVQWVRIGSASSLLRNIRPRLILAVSEKTLDKLVSDLRLEEFRRELYEQCGDTLAEVFSKLHVIQLGGEHLSPLARHCRLKSIILKNVREMSI